MTGEPFGNDATYRTVTPYMGQTEDLDLQKEVGKIHMYDSLLLGNKGKAHKQESRAMLRKKLMQTIARTKNSTIDVMHTPHG